MERNGEAAGLQPELAPESQKRSCATTYDPTLCLTSAKLYARLLGYGVGDGILFDCAQFEPAEKASATKRGSEEIFFDPNKATDLVENKVSRWTNPGNKATVCTSS